jgi:hypothetical protein
MLLDQYGLAGMRFFLATNDFNNAIRESNWTMLA